LPSSTETEISCRAVGIGASVLHRAEVDWPSAGKRPAARTPAIPVSAIACPVHGYERISQKA
jgi:hypothetical protein